MSYSTEEIWRIHARAVIDELGEPLAKSIAIQNTFYEGRRRRQPNLPPAITRLVRARVRPLIATVARSGAVTIKKGGARRGGIKRDERT